MASTVLPNGIIVPEKFSRDWYADLYHNWQELDNLLGGGTPKDGTLTIQKNGDTVGTFSADVNNGTLTIQQNGTTVDSFSANSSADKAVNIQCVDLSNNQTVGGIKTFSNAPVVGSINLDGKSIDTDANGNMTFDSHIVDTIEEQGDGYIRYSNGLQICWTTNDLISTTSYGTWTYPKTFISIPCVLWQAWGQNTGIFDVAGGGIRTAVYAEFIPFRTSAGLYAAYGVSGLAIGRWK